MNEQLAIPRKCAIFRVARTHTHPVTQSIEPATARIPVRSKRQAMDWSLMLVSQGIEGTIDQDPENGWGLIVAPHEHDRSLRLIRQYRLENLRWPWRQKIRQTVLFDWGCLAWVFLIGLFYWIDRQRLDLHPAGAMDGAAVSHGQWWRVFTAMFLHADLGHLAANAGFGLVLLGLTMGVYGTGVGLLAGSLAGVGGNLLALLIDPSHRSLGASGMVMGCLGLLAAQSVSIRHDHPRLMKSMLGGMLSGVMLFLLLGSSPGTDLVAHLGGFVSGVLLGVSLRSFPRWADNVTANILAGGVFCVLVIWTWWLAVDHGS
jgi:rhomboid protease GluP